MVKTARLRRERVVPVTGRILTSVLAQWDAHGDACAPEDHPDRQDATACARGEHR